MNGFNSPSVTASNFHSSSLSPPAQSPPGPITSSILRADDLAQDIHARISSLESLLGSVLAPIPPGSLKGDPSNASCLMHETLEQVNDKLLVASERLNALCDRVRI